MYKIAVNFYSVNFSDTYHDGIPLNWKISNLNCKYQGKIIFHIYIPELRFGSTCDLWRLSKTTRNLWYHTIQHQNWCFSRLVLSCQKHNLESILTDCIYRICYKNAKNGKPSEINLPFLENDITGSELTVKILDT